MHTAEGARLPRKILVGLAALATTTVILAMLHRTYAFQQPSSDATAFEQIAVSGSRDSVSHSDSAQAHGTPLYGSCQLAERLSREISAKATGKIGTLLFYRNPARPPDMRFLDTNGAEIGMDHFGGRSILINIWATWCPPCRDEMKYLDKLQAEFGGSGFEVVAVNVDTRRPDYPRQWLADNGIDNLAYYSEPSGALMSLLRRTGHLIGLPVTILVAPDSCELALMRGAAEWSSPDAVALVEALLERTGDR
jgi:thiol-disulfide isomerase/thioredoxin